MPTLRARRSQSQSASSAAADQLQTTLTRSLQECIQATVSSVCASFQHAGDEATTTSRASVDGSSDYDRYYVHCRRLVDYIVQNMETPPDFVTQMDRIILACHRGASERVLSALVATPLWFHRRGDAPPLCGEEKEQQQQQQQQQHQKKKKDGSDSCSTRRSSRHGSAVAAVSTADKKKKKKKGKSSPPSAENVAKKSPTASAAHAGSGARSKRGTGASEQDTRPPKRTRRVPREVIHGTSDEKEIKVEKRHKEGKAVQEPEDEDEALSFEDAIGELCYPDQRTQAETKFFKDRLRSSIRFVDALLCKPPRGKVCRRGCKKIRAQMCSSSRPCKNKMCRIWHDVEAHTDCCLNPRCEFKIRVLLRETMHKVEMNKQHQAVIEAKLRDKHTELKKAVDDDKDAVENDIVNLEHDLETCDDEMGVLKASTETFWRNLNDIGIEVKDDAIDNFPDFDTHYGDKKGPRKTAEALSTSSHPSSSHGSSRNSRTTSRHAGGPHASVGPHARVGPHASTNKDAEDNDGCESASGSMYQCASRRNTHIERFTRRAMMDGLELHCHSSSDPPQEDEPPLPPSGPPPFRQNPELDGESAGSVSGYPIDLVADDHEAEAATANIERTASNGSREERMADMQLEGDKSFGIMASVSFDLSSEEPANRSPHTPLGDPFAATDTRIKSSAAEPRPTDMDCSSPLAEYFTTADFAIREDQLRDL
ncbi:unnamed protein product [Hyaloperonospora brassicae]|uniref:TAZ-type domain-containing protein n=1 Tax=Hyaloperonospora brassicae TaxID=162125 RepID=A0AAV0T1C4_HYABA|nr:unnamed protein product [Hyaloperonospora brassicae]